jgi:hypothetical protein
MNCKRISQKAREIIARLRTLNLPQRIKGELLLLWRHARVLVESVIGFVVRHNHLGECLVLGAVVAYLLAKVPAVGGFLALVALVTAASVGLMVGLRKEIESVFTPAD